MPFTRCSRASSSTSGLAVLLARRWRLVLGGGGAVLGGLAALGGGLAAVGGSSGVPGGSHAVAGGSGAVLSGSCAILGGGALDGLSALGGGGTGLGALAGPAGARALAVRLGRPAGPRLGVLGVLGVFGALRLGGVLGFPVALRLLGLFSVLGVLGLRGVRRGGRPAGPALFRLGLGRLQRLGDRRSEGFLLVRPGLSGLHRALGPGQALELLPVTGDLKQATDRVGGLCTHRQPVLHPLRVDLDERGLFFGVVLADLLDRPAIPLGAGIGDDDPVKGRTNLPHALELDLDSHCCGLLP